MLKKSKGVLVASTLALAAAGGTIAVVRVASSGTETAAAAAQPMPVGSAVTARVPSGAGSADGTGTSGGTGTGTSGGAGGGQGGAGTTGVTGASSVSPRDVHVPASAGQGEQGPLPAGAVSSDGAVPGALSSVRAMAAARAATAALPHSPQLLNQLAGSAGWAGDDAAPAPASSGAAASPAAASDAASDGATSSSTTSATATASASATPTPTPTDAATAAVPPVSASADSAMAGLDVAAYQHPDTSQYPNGVPINWSQVYAAGYRFAAVKGTEGDYYVNPWAATDLAEAKAAGLDVTPYHFAIPNGSSGKEQAEYAVEYSGYTAGARTLPLMLDIEYDPYVSSDGTNECYGLSAAQMTSWISAFVTETKALTGERPIIYTTANWWDACTGSSTAFSADPMWVANYDVGRPALPTGWPSWAFWQYTSSGTVPGVDSAGTTDLDLFSPTEIGLVTPGSLASRPLTRVSVPLVSLGASVGEKLTWGASGLPPGVRVSADGVLTGVISDTGSSQGATSYHASVTASNTAGASSTVTFSWQVAASCPGHVSLGICPEG